MIITIRSPLLLHLAGWKTTPSYVSGSLRLWSRWFRTARNPLALTLPIRGGQAAGYAPVPGPGGYILRAIIRAIPSCTLWQDDLNSFVYRFRPFPRLIVTHETLLEVG